jgi:hypothetical protein
MNNVCEVVVTAITPNGSATLPFVIPSAAEGSAVHSAFATKVRVKTNLSSRPERSVVEGPAVPSTSTQLDRKPRLFIGTRPRDLQFRGPFLEMFRTPEDSTEVVSVTTISSFTLQQPGRILGWVLQP